MTADELRLHAAEIVKGYRNRHTRRMLDREANRFLDWYEMEGYDEFDRGTLADYTDYLTGISNSSAKINHGALFVALLTKQLIKNGLVDGDTAYFATTISRLPRDKTLVEALDVNVIHRLLEAPDKTLQGSRDRAVLCVLFGCGLDRAECAGLTIDQLCHGHLTLVRGRRGKARNVPIPAWVNEAILGWLNESGIETGPLFPSLADLQQGRAERPMSPQSIYNIVRKHAANIDLRISPNELRRTHFSLKENDATMLHETIVKLNREIASLRRALNIKANLTPDRLRSATMQHWERRDIDQP